MISIAFECKYNAMAILMLGIMPYVCTHTQDYLKGYKLGKEDVPETHIILTCIMQYNGTLLHFQANNIPNLALSK
jgi:hypothetical protein